MLTIRLKKFEEFDSVGCETTTIVNGERVETHEMDTGGHSFCIYGPIGFADARCDGGIVMDTFLGQNGYDSIEVLNDLGVVVHALSIR